MDRYREKRKDEGRSEATVNRELSILRTAYHNARRRTPPKVAIVPYFPMVQETTVRKGFLTDLQYATLRNALPQELKALFVTAYITGIRRGELLAIRWRQVDFEARTITLDHGETKNQDARSVPIIGVTWKTYCALRRPPPQNPNGSLTEMASHQGFPLGLGRGMQNRRSSRSQLPRLTPNSGPQHAPRRNPASHQDEDLRPQDRQYGAPL